jgi:single-strand DNA-binding protein
MKWGNEMNKLLLVGRLTKDPELRGSENNVCLFTLAVSRAYTNTNGEREADFIPVKTFKKLAENCSKFLQKGSMVSVEAAVRTGLFEKDGKKTFTMEVIADEVRFLGGTKGYEGDNNSTNNRSNRNQNQNNNRNNQIDDDPFPGTSDYNASGDDDWPF